MIRKTLEKTLILVIYLSLAIVVWDRFQPAEVIRFSRQPIAAPKPAQPKPEAIRQYTYLFEGTASSEDRTALPGANVLVQIRSPRGTQIQIAKADGDGRYSMAVQIEAADHDPVDWILNTYLTDGEQLGVDGRRIVLKDDEVIVVHDGVHSLSEPTLPPTNRGTHTTSNAALS